jgi:hypothetical protein
MVRINTTSIGSILLASRFGKKAMNEMVKSLKWVNQHTPPRPDAVSILESGNGALLFALAEGRGEACHPAHRFPGIDYSEGAVQLAQSMAHSRNLTAIMITFSCMRPEDPPLLANQNGAWDLILDKGTYDAITLMEKDGDERIPVLCYPMRVAKLLNPGGHFLITCEYVVCDLGLKLNPGPLVTPARNFTKFELQSKFITEETGIQYQYVAHIS